MPRNYIRKTDKAATYSQEKLKEAVNAVKTGKLSGYAASKYYKIPRSTIINHVYERRGLKSNTLGRSTTLSREMEENLVKNLHIMEKHGFGLTRNELLETVGQFISKNNIVNPFKNGTPGEDWFLAFKKRHNLSIKKPQPVEYARKKACSPAMEPRQRTSIEQFSALLDFMERNGDLSARLNTPANTTQNTASAQSAVSVSLPPSPQPSTAQPAPAQQPAQAAAAQPTAAAEPTVAAQATPQPVAALAAPIPAATPQDVQNNNQQPPRVYRRRRRRSSASSATNTTSRRRELLTARRNSGQTPFERAANHFTDIELRRLEFEEQRDKRNHELEVERIRIEAQRVDVSRQQTVLLRQLYQLGQQIIAMLSNHTGADQNEQLQ